MAAVNWCARCFVRLAAVVLALASLPATAAELTPRHLEGRWAGRVQDPRGPARSWMQERRADGHYTIDLELPGDTPVAQRSRLVGRWTLREGGVYEDQRAGPVGGHSPPERYRVQAAAHGCLRFTLLRDDAAQPAQPAYTFDECPVPLPAPTLAAPRRCSAQMPAMGRPDHQSLLVRLEPSPGEGIQAYVNDELINDQVEVSDHAVHPDMLRRQAAALNLGEAVLRSAVEAAADRRLMGGLRLPFDAHRVRYIRVFKLEPGSSASKFGGAMLFDAFDADGRLLGTVLQALLPMTCLADKR